MSALCFFPCPFLGNSVLIPVFLILSGMFAGAAQPVSSAMITDLTDKENRRQAFSLLYMGTNIGFSIGPMIAGFLYKNHTNWIFYGNAFAILISLVLILLFVEDEGRSRKFYPRCEFLQAEDVARARKIALT